MSTQGSHSSGAPAPLLELLELRTHFFTDEGVARAVDGVSCSVLPGQSLGLVGESGCGKSVTALSIMGLVPRPGRVVAGRVLFQGEDLLLKSEDELRALRGGQIAMVFQEPMTALNPVFSIGSQIIEAIELHTDLDPVAARAHAIAMLRRVGIPNPERRADDFPHQLSGGMQQRVMIAMAISCRPALLIADEPTTALDVTIQAQILDLIRELQVESGMSLLLITHDLAVVAETAQHVAVMYAGKIVEHAAVGDFFERPRHPYSIGLLRALPGRSRANERAAGRRLPTIPGIVPNATRFPSGCRFRTRCPVASERCALEEPSLQAARPASGHAVACHHPEEALGL
ncbi:MAG: peptide/nickel transport system ATP-binding protein [Chlamydiales bacterium]